MDGDKFDEKSNPRDNGYGFETNRTVLTMFLYSETKRFMGGYCKGIGILWLSIGHERSTRSIYDFLKELVFKIYL